MILQRILTRLGFEISDTFGEECQKQGLAFAEVDKPIIKRMKHFWAEQGDYISLQYAGTNSTISRVSRDGK